MRVAIAGAGAVGTSIAKELIENGHEVMLIDKDPKAIKVYDAGRKNTAVWHMLRDNIRASDLVVGDMEAQIAAARIGAERYVELIRRYGLDTVNAACG